MAFFKLESRPPIRDIMGRFQRAGKGVDGDLREMFRIEGRRFIDLAGEESPGSGQTMKKGYFFRTFITSNGIELKVFPGKLGKWHMQGTGIYGPRRALIVPIRAKALHFFIGGREFFRKWVRGIKPNPIFSRAYRRWLPGARTGLRRVAMKYVRTLQGARPGIRELRP